MLIERVFFYWQDIGRTRRILRAGTGILKLFLNRKFRMGTVSKWRRG